MSDNDQILKIYRWYKAAMGSVGKKVKWPNARDKTKTYMYRDMKSFAIKVNEMGVDDRAASEMVWAVVKYAKDNKMLNRRSALLTKQDILEICIDKLRSDLEAERNVVKGLERSRSFLEKELGSGQWKNGLLRQPKNGSFANITMWFQSDLLSRAYIALSRSCGSALLELSEDDRSCFPSDLEILRIRNKLLRNEELRPQIENILKSDLATGGVA